MKLLKLKDYQNPHKDYRLPAIPRKLRSVLKKENKPVILKKKIIIKNKNNHPEIALTEYDNILRTGLYKTQEVLQPNFQLKPNYFNFIARAENNTVVVIELADTKKEYEIVGFFKINNRKLNIMRKKTYRDGGQSIITDQPC
ncbi:MAG: hypothetical protein LBQ83_06945 [Candidatus Margulisbacteria bacterium]|jgi:hypothetical protein|nr:hypothetical protein [Candidatus Margulisiibacteriota bacterium]